MRSRLLGPVVALAMVTVVALGVPMMIALARSATQDVQLSRSAALNHIALLADEAIQTSQPMTLRRYLERFHQVTGESVLVIGARESTVSSVGSLDADHPDVHLVALTALRGVPQTAVATVVPWGADTALLAVPVGTGTTTTGAVILRADLDLARDEVLVNWLLVGALGAALMAGLVVASLLWSGWVLRPVRALDAAARTFPHRRELEAVQGGPPELRHLARSVSRMAAGLEGVLEQQRGFVADASHQLRNPLAAIRLRVDSLADGDGTEAEEMDAVARDVDRLEHIVNRMLVLATVEHRATSAVTGLGDQVAEDSRHDHTVPSAASLVEPFAMLMADAGQTLRVIGTTAVRIACRRSDLEEILGNLLENARKYAGVGATVTVRLTLHETAAQIVVEDDGPGLTVEETAQVGIRFWRAARHSQVPGTGLGLAIVHQLALANEGSLVVASGDHGGLRATLSFKALR